MTTTGNLVWRKHTGRSRMAYAWRACGALAPQGFKSPPRRQKIPKTTLKQDLEVIARDTTKARETDGPCHASTSRSLLNHGSHAYTRAYQGSRNHPLCIRMEHPPSSNSLYVSASHFFVSNYSSMPSLFKRENLNKISVFSLLALKVCS